MLQHHSLFLGRLINFHLIITKHVYGLLEKECHLKKVTLPVDATENEPKSFIFMSEDALTNPDKLLVLIHGNGVVRAGQWARRLIINEDLDSGTQIPYIKKATEEGYGVIVLNPNENYIEVEKTKAQVQLSSDSSDEPAEKRERKDKMQKETKKRRDFYEKYRNPQKEKETMQMYIRDNGSPEEHAIYVWDHFISQSAAENVFFVAHSYGGLAFVELMIQREAEVKNKVTAVALTDSVHNVWHQEAGKTIREWMRENCCNWVSSSEPLDTSVESMLPDCPRVSAAAHCNEEKLPVKEQWIPLPPCIGLYFEKASPHVLLLTQRPFGSCQPSSGLGHSDHFALRPMEVALHGTGLVPARVKGCGMARPAWPSRSRV
ncbi:protein FAM172A isoform X4 [Numida meleagris]|uniref:protein FAM172A isoform X4 n=1 Tax=Numida meleagris TaxID=8996 RepID=UPI000B3D8BD5|nr:protein FAM172A isoform X4 [Numida meleagris]